MNDYREEQKLLMEFIKERDEMIRESLISLIEERDETVCVAIRELIREEFCDFIRSLLGDNKISNLKIEPNKESREIIKSDMTTRERVTQIVKDLGCRVHLKGYNYLIDAISETVDNPDAVEVITKIMYPTIAKKYKVTSSKVERAIRFAIEEMHVSGNLELIEKIFKSSISYDKGKATNKQFIATIAEYIRSQKY